MGSNDTALNHNKEFTCKRRGRKNERTKYEGREMRSSGAKKLDLFTILTESIIVCLSIGTLEEKIDTPTYFFFASLH